MQDWDLHLLKFLDNHVTHAPSSHPTKLIVMHTLFLTWFSYKESSSKTNVCKYPTSHSLVVHVYTLPSPPAHSKLEKGEKEVMLKEALSNAKLWEARYQAAEKSRQEYRENTRRIVLENERMQNAVNQVSHQYTHSSHSTPPHTPPSSPSTPSSPPHSLHRLNGTRLR